MTHIQTKPQPQVHYFGEKPKRNESSFFGKIGNSALNCTGTLLLTTIAVAAVVATIGLTILSYAAFATGVGIGVGIALAVGALATGALSSYTFSKSIDCFIGIFGSFC